MSFDCFVLIFQTTCAVHAGASGGGVFNTRGQLVAMVVCNSRYCSVLLSKKQGKELTYRKLENGDLSWNKASLIWQTSCKSCWKNVDEKIHVRYDLNMMFWDKKFCLLRCSSEHVCRSVQKCKLACCIKIIMYQVLYNFLCWIILVTSVLHSQA